MPRRRRDREPDTRLDWRDPDMPLLRPFERPWGEYVLDAEPPEKEQEFRQEMMKTSKAADWRLDESYNLGQPGIATKRALRRERKGKR